MKNLICLPLTLLLVCGISFSGSAQLLTETFETDGEGSRYTSNSFYTACADFYQRIDNQPLVYCVTNHPTNPNGSFYWGSEDNDAAAGGEGILTLNPLVVTGFALDVDIFLAIGRPNDLRFEPADYLILEYNMDGGGWNQFAAFYGSNDVLSGSGNLVQDTDLNGLYNAGALEISSSDFADLNFTIPVTGNSVQVRIRSLGNAGTEEIIFDNIRINGTVACADLDSDTFTDFACGGTDCNDGDNTIFPGATEVCDNADNDCDGTVDNGLGVDADTDGHGDPASCVTDATLPIPYDDCDDSDINNFPTNPEVCDNADNDCNTVIDNGLGVDADTDGHGDPASCVTDATLPIPYDDCDDADINNYPTNLEVCDGVDNDCDLLVDEGLADDATFNYSAGSYCVNDADPTPTISGVPGGGFTSSPAGLSINAGTGIIDVSASMPGAYTITYTTSGSCPNSSNQAVTINALDDVTFNYSSGTYCLGESDPTPTISGLPGGGFSSVPAGLNINPTTGFINIGLSVPQGYTVTYTTTGSCPNSSNVGVTIGTPPAAPSVVSPMTVCPGAPIILTATGSGTGNLMFYNSVPNLLGVVPMPPATGSLNIGGAAPGPYTFGVTESNGVCQSLPTAIIVTVGDVMTPTAVCQNINVYVDGAGNASIVAADIDGGSSDNCGAVTLSASQTAFTCDDVASPFGELIITGVYDATIVGGTPKGVEVYVANDIADLSQYGIGFANNGGGTDGEEFTFPAVSATAGQYIYVSSEVPNFTSWFGFAPDYTSTTAAINGDDAIELFHLGAVIDVFGDINLDGSGQPWEYMDGWAYR
ncbi:MAG: hypothetical protein HRT57_11785, partial [Crocinitomicaceae bacterium]|nr:hypothetical protein [Crocinitomicaceae bacterium]